jgi:hypothetical protein
VYGNEEIYPQTVRFFFHAQEIYKN